MTGSTRAAAAVEAANADTTPMIDVVFLMIVFFVCLDFRTLEAKLCAYLPRDVGGSSKIEPVEQLLVTLVADRVGVPVYAAGVVPGSIDPATGRRFRYQLRDHRVRWQIGAQEFVDPKAAQRELARLAADPRCQVRDERTGGRKVMECVVEGLQGVRYDDVAKAADAARAAGFAEIHFGGGVPLPRR